MARSKLLSTAYKLIDGFNAWDEDLIFGCRTEDCRHQFWPPRTPDAQGSDNAEARQHFLDTKDIFKNFHVDVLETAEDPEKHRVVMFAHAEMDTAAGGKILDYILLIDVDDTNDKIKRILQSTQTKDKPA
ncbi:hypothetical protein AUEXF2481DRAFT_84132 [Aureobasidium subglaciale EXF-2481]|uniref:SnoaL-like domain-containing protein n=1 Tax=Aureobasidium subglaciale (strain EXF-2481) TaxID=1043005 RepID=A0A074XXC6_AURSE|nr:uncharacterized protein AUEXF2481DRAFT_84132 [Aureobasidium subglaciale EXF-2481]KAI5194186.1 hypothetical protein E4T38_09679 [Aureobasidium subglaciale]KAI5213609.1 hypothetical protein E4T40_09621 [Aureobasidium subglaciale]KAI5215268.1 hypothetical protein E4T41_09659 [Aureobasidium subglaciale]KAI5253258.1 hypothetical protein E4T46_09636 [Aureobasidium subglaciale]KEQ90228.1 hypothetical protein AUEXF2481DRAFT_84132 [Aureobasidium subglaciale EXF-2481]